MDLSVAREISRVDFRQRLVNRWVCLTFLILIGGSVLFVFVLRNPYSWPFIELGRRTSFLFGCTTLACAPFAWGIGIVYMYLFSVLFVDLVGEIYRFREQ